MFFFIHAARPISYGRDSTKNATDCVIADGCQDKAFGTSAILGLVVGNGLRCGSMAIGPVIGVSHGSIVALENWAKGRGKRHHDGLKYDDMEEGGA